MTELVETRNPNGTMTAEVTGLLTATIRIEPASGRRYDVVTERVPATKTQRRRFDEYELARTNALEQAEKLERDKKELAAREIEATNEKRKKMWDWSTR